MDDFDTSAATGGPGRDGNGRLWRSYAALCLLCWLLYAMAGTEWDRGSWHVWDGVYEATLNLAPPIVLGAFVLPWVRRLQRRPADSLATLPLHLLGAIAFAVAWQLVDFAVAWGLFGADHATATFQQRVLWRAMWGVFAYFALVFGFGSALHARRAQRVALSAARAEAALVRAELANISGKLNPHFLFNTLNSLLILTRKDALAAEQALLRFSRMMRYVLDTTRSATDRVALQDEIDFVRDYLWLESLRFGARLRVDWQIDPATLADEIPPLTLQPLVENSIVHGIAPQIAGGTVRIESQRRTDPAALALTVRDDGAGCQWPPATTQGVGVGVGLSALKRRFELDFDGAASLRVQSRPGNGFQVEILIPLGGQAMTP
ncbi:MAG TPA: histidine kinase [Caldimonas sp.]|nr:histidine kinase [Caldimonas sp.]HEV7575785.1 histidine kinase [Caldimonas sp.]